MFFAENGLHWQLPVFLVNFLQPARARSGNDSVRYKQSFVTVEAHGQRALQPWLSSFFCFRKFRDIYGNIFFERLCLTSKSPAGAVFSQGPKQERKWFFL